MHKGLTSTIGWTSIIDWKDAKDDDLVRSVSIDTTLYWEQLGKERNLWLPYLFMNDAARDQNPLASYGATNLARLREIAAEYDRDQLFQKQQSGGFLLSRA